MTAARLGLLMLLTAGGCSARPAGQDEGSTSDASTSGAASATAVDGTGVATTGSTMTTPTPGTTGPLGTTGSSSDGESDDDESETCPFVCDPDVAPTTFCDVIDQDCPEGSKCVWYVPPGSSQRRDAARCIPVEGEGEPFDPCTLPNGIGPEITDDCGPTSYCLDVYGLADHGFCAPFLDPNFACDLYPGTIPALENGSDFPAACLHFECQPLIPNYCPAGMGCTFYPAYLYGSMMCWNVPPEYDLPVGAACDPGQCGEGKLCAPNQWLPDCAHERCCAQFCDLGAPACDTMGTACEFFPVWNFPGEPGFETLGACVLPGTFD